MVSPLSILVHMWYGALPVYSPLSHLLLQDISIVLGRFKHRFFIGGGQVYTQVFHYQIPNIIRHRYTVTITMPFDFVFELVLPPEPYDTHLYTPNIICGHCGHCGYNALTYIRLIKYCIVYTYRYTNSLIKDTSYVILRTYLCCIWYTLYTILYYILYY